MVRCIALVLALLLLPDQALAQARVGVRVGDHPGHGRVVFDWPSHTGYELEEAEGRAVLRFAAPGALDLAAARRMPRNIRGIEATDGAATLTLAPGVRLRVFRLGNRIVVDALDAAPAERGTTTAAPRSARATAPATPLLRVQRSPAASTPPTSAPAVIPAVIPAATPEPPLVAEPVAPRPAPLQPLPGGFVVPASAEVGAALLARGDVWLLVLDALLPLDTAPLRQGALAGAELSSGAHATVLRLPRAALPEPRLTRRPDGWLLENAGAPPPLRSIRPELLAGPPVRLLLRAARPANSVAVLDPETGGTLLVGTVREGGEATPIGRRAAPFEVLPTRLGAAILPRADSVTLRSLPAGFAADPGPGTALTLGPDAESDATGMSRLFDLPAEPLTALVQRERNATLAVAAAPPLGRGPPRLRNAEALLALGLGAEAQAMAALAMREDPRAAQDPMAIALQGAAALLAGRIAEADGLLDRRLPETDELVLWRGLLAAARGEDGAAGIAASLPILRAWPDPLRNRLSPLAAEALAGSGETNAAGRLLTEGDPAFGLARARLLEADGAAPAALAAYDAVIQGRDRRARAVAMRRAAELRLGSGALDAAGAAAAMEAVLAAWRGDAMEREARLRMAELRLQAGNPRGAFEALREVEQGFPETAATVRPRQAEALLAAIAQEPPISAVTLFDAHAALLPPGEQTEIALNALAERLAALDLTDRARAVLGGALARVTAPESRGRLGLALAKLALGAGDAAAARAALAETDAAGLPDALRGDRLRTDARALAAMGAFDRAADRLREAGPDALPDLAELLASRQDWVGAAAAMGAHLPRALPPAPAKLGEDGRRLVARAAALLALAGDEAGIAALAAAEGPRMEGGAFADAFAVMTAGRVGGIRDLPRLRRELEVARLLPSRLVGRDDGRLEGLRASPGEAR